MPEAESNQHLASEEAAPALAKGTQIDMRIIALKVALTIPVAYALSYPFLNPSGEGGILGEITRFGPALSGGAVAAFLLAVFLYCRDLSSTLSLVSPGARAAHPKSVWLMFLIPYNFVEDFFIVVNVAKSLQQEADQVSGLASLRSGGIVSGIGWCSAQILSLMPNALGSIAGLLALLFWVAHWRFIRSAMTVLQTRELTGHSV